MFKHKVNPKLQRFMIFSLIASLCIGCFLPTQSQAFGNGAHGPDVYAVQGMMKSLGFYAGTIDGKFGYQSMQGVKLFQRQYGLPVTGAVDSKTLESILWAYAKLKIPQHAAQKPPAEPQAPDKAGAEELLLLKLVNQERTGRKLAALSLDVPLSKVAEAKSQD